MRSILSLRYFVFRFDFRLIAIIIRMDVPEAFRLGYAYSNLIHESPGFLPA